MNLNLNGLPDEDKFGMTGKELEEAWVGTKRWFEYHCEESHQSCAAQAWYRSHQKVKVLEMSGDDVSDLTQRERIEDGMMAVFKVQFADGYESDAFEDELLDDPAQFVRPDPPAV